MCLPSAWNPHPPTLHIQIHLPSVRSCLSNSPTYPSWGRMRFLPIIPLVLASKYNYLFIALYLLLIWSSASTFYFPATNWYWELLNKILLNKWIILKIAFPNSYSFKHRKWYEAWRLSREIMAMKWYIRKILINSKTIQ